MTLVVHLLEGRREVSREHQRGVQSLGPGEGVELGFPTRPT
jgi:hypothetical protein